MTKLHTTLTLTRLVGYVEYAAAVAREYGWRIGINYTVMPEIHAVRTPYVAVYRLHMNDVSVDATLRFPNSDEGVSQYARDATHLVPRLQYACARLVHAYGVHYDLHPSETDIANLIADRVLTEDRVRTIERAAAAACGTVLFRHDACVTSRYFADHTIATLNR